MKIKVYNTLIILSSILMLIGCSSDDDTSTIDPNGGNPVQPDAVQPNNTFSGTIGFWDFGGDGRNSVSMEVPGRSEDWFVNGVGFNYDEQGLVIDESAEASDAEKNRVNLINSNEGGLAQQRYFSGAIRFKVKKDPDDVFAFPLLSFGLNPRFLDLEIWNGNIRMTTNNSNIIKSTDIQVKEDVWNVLYFRYEGFNPATGDNTFYVQLNNGNEVALDLENFDINNSAGNKDNISLGFSSRGFIFQGNVDWVILGLGRMTPGNAQYLIDEMK
ncbi:hypothetical protein GTQ40_17330 [Flavobacteriaceae bacterium R38]|nr:hypothetical protein [Flavobacteriaceae bacterium R38]